MSGAQRHSRSEDPDEGAPALGKGRSRIVTFRVSVEEFGALARACHASGSRSLSAFARAAALDKVNTLEGPPVTLSGDLTTLTKRLAQIDAALQETRKTIRRVLGPATDEPWEDPSDSGQT
jgi:hypothetical protein